MGPLVRVELVVVPQGGLVGKPLGAGGALVGLLSRVDPHVLLQVGEAGEGLTAHSAGVT